MAYLILAKQKKVSRPPRRQSGIRSYQTTRCATESKASTGSARTVCGERLRYLNPILRYACVPCPELVEGSGRTGTTLRQAQPERFAVKGFDISTRSFDTLAYPVLSLSKGQDERKRGFDRLSPNGMKKFGSGHFQGQSPLNKPTACAPDAAAQKDSPH